jgi:hypothetical protein
MALLDLKEKNEWADFASKESIVVDSNGSIDAKETQVMLALLYCNCLLRLMTLCCSKRDLQSKQRLMRVRGDSVAEYLNKKCDMC